MAATAITAATAIRAASAITIKILSKEHTNACLSVDTKSNTCIVEGKEVTDDSNGQKWIQIEYADQFSSFQNPETGNYMCPDDRAINPHGVKIAVATDPYKWALEQQDDYLVISIADKSKCITMDKESHPVNLENRNGRSEKKYFWKFVAA